MANFILSYDLNGPRPSHAEMDKHLATLGAMFVRARVLETVWYVAGPTTALELHNYVRRVLSPNDRVLVVQTGVAAFSNLLVDQSSFTRAYDAQARAA